MPFGELKPERLHVILSAEEAEAIDDYRFTARLPSRAETMTHLANLALKGELPARHKAALARIAQERAGQHSRDFFARSAEETSQRDRVHITLEPEEVADIDDYRRATIHIPSRQEAIRELVSIALQGAYAPEHVQTLKLMGANRLSGALLRSQLRAPKL
jgi:hypothetical protein